MHHLFDPSDSRPLHFLGIGGAGMSALALAARRRGIVVSGCDTEVAAFPDLQAAGISTFSAPDPQHSLGARALVVTAAAAADHPEIVAARAAGVPVVPRKVALAELVNGGTLVALSGTHGKTTTTVMTTLALRAAGLAASGLAGGRVAAWGGNALLDDGKLFVVEADEYDQAFLTLQPTVAVVNNVEADHLECYASLEAMEDAYVTFASRAAHRFIGTADAGSDRVARRIANGVIRFGLEDAADIRLNVTAADETGSRATVTFPDRLAVELRLQVPGLHNLRNATAALAATHALGGDCHVAAAALADFGGVGRRFERLGDAGGISYVDDYAHHPTELAVTLAAARQAFPGRRLVAAFQPHLYSRTRQHGAEMGRLLAAADLVIVTDVYAAREAPVEGVSGKLVADAAMMAGAMVCYEPRRSALSDEVRGLLREGDVLLTMGAGDITLVGRELLASPDADS
ncbi:MAG: UDP-N-acetylmuramate--L-alanine ligase [Gemmatimonadales bacterium]|nr:UDP-N-acetylmuramate--L-alanine ligase [Gemmatimonadales bacterium]